MSESVQGWVTSADKKVKATIISYASDGVNRQEVFSLGVLKLAQLMSGDLFLPIQSVLDDLESDADLVDLREGKVHSWQSFDKKYKFNIQKPH